MRERKCLRNFLWFKWCKHTFEKMDIKEDVKIIGKKLCEDETGIYIRRFTTTIFYQCKKCKEKKDEVKVQEEICRQYY